MLADARSYILTYPPIALFPISCAVLAFNLLGDGLRDALDPQST
jgi:dipeptide transport system permease protein